MYVLIKLAQNQPKVIKKTAKFSSFVNTKNMKKVLTQVFIEMENQQKPQKNPTKLNFDILKYAGKNNNNDYFYFETSQNLLFDINMQNYLCEQLVLSLKQILKKTYRRVLIVGLGNNDLSADSLGVQTVNKIVPNVFMQNKKTHIYLLKAGVFGVTGIESADVTKALVKYLGCDLVVAIDTLVAKEACRLGTSFQLSMGGVTPGAGVKNARKSLNEAYLNVKTLLIGVPMVIYSNDLCENTEKNLVLTHKDNEMYIKCASRVISLALNKYFNNFDAKDVYEYFC